MSTKWDKLKEKRLSPQQIKRVRERALHEVLEMRLAELRKELGVTQAELAQAADMSQSELSRLERREDHLLSTVRRYVEALGGKVEVTAVVGDKRVRLLDL